MTRRSLRRPLGATLAFGSLGLLMAGLHLTCSAGDSSPAPDDTTGGAPGHDPGAGGAATSGSGAGGSAGEAAAAGAAGASGGTGGGDLYVSSCEEQVCTADELCVPGRFGTYCVHPCPGQPCPPGDASLPYCTRAGGVICAVR